MVKGHFWAQSAWPVSMKPRRFFVEGEPLQSGERLVTGKRANHLTRVLRLGVGEPVVLFDGSGREFPAEILEVGRQLIRFKVSAGKGVDRESHLRLMLALGLPRPGVMDLIVQKVTELGVNEIVPLRTERAQPWLAGEKDLTRIKRWGRIAQEAARQSGRNLVPHIWPLTDFPQLLKLTADYLKVYIDLWKKEEPSPAAYMKELNARKNAIRAVFQARDSIGDMMLTKAIGKELSRLSLITQF